MESAGVDLGKRSHLQSMRLLLLRILPNNAITLCVMVDYSGPDAVRLCSERVADEDDTKTLFVIVDGIPADVIERLATPAIDSISAEVVTPALMWAVPLDSRQKPNSLSGRLSQPHYRYLG